MNIAIGECLGTGAAINVCCGFIPDFVYLIQPENTEKVHLWHRAMAQITLCDEGIDMGDGSDAMEPLAANGLAEYAGGDEIIYDLAQTRWENSAGANVEQVYVDGANIKGASGADYVCIGDVLVPSNERKNNVKIKTPKGFRVGTSVQTISQVLCWVAIGK